MGQTHQSTESCHVKKNPVFDHEVQVHDLQYDSVSTFTYSCTCCQAGASSFKSPTKLSIHFNVQSYIYLDSGQKAILKRPWHQVTFSFYPFSSADTSVNGVQLQVTGLNTVWLKMTLPKEPLKISL